MDAALSSSAPADTESVPVPDRSRGPETDPSPVPSPDADTPTAEQPLVAHDAPSRIPEDPSTTASPPTPAPDVPPPAQDPSAADGQPPPPAAVPLPPPPGPEARDLRPGRKAQQDADVGSAAKDTSGCPCKGGGRNLVVCIDGTSNQFSKKNTNVVELYSRLVKENDKQLTFYNSGIGTYARPSWRSFSYYKQVIANKLDLAFALRFDKIIIGSYEWLADNYVEGDRIFLFGFSRGAYQVRALSAMIDRMGLIHKGNADQIPFAYELYSHDDDEDDSLSHGVFAVLWQIIRWALYDLTFPQHLWLAWNAAENPTALKRITIWIVLMFSLLLWIWTVGRNDTSITSPQTLTLDHDEPHGPKTNYDPDAMSDDSHCGKFSG